MFPRTGITKILNSNSGKFHPTQNDTSLPTIQEQLKFISKLVLDERRWDFTNGLIDPDMLIFELEHTQNT